MVLVEYHNSVAGDNHMHWSNVEQIIKWATRLFNLEIVLFGFVSMHYLNFPPTFPFLGAMMCLYYLHLVWSQYGNRKREDAETILDMYSRFISGE